MQNTKYSKNENKKRSSSFDITTSKFITSISQKNLIIQKKYNIELPSKVKCKIYNTNNHQTSLQNANNYIKDIPKNLNNMINMNGNINVHNTNFKNNYINIVNLINQKKEDKKDERITVQQNMIKPQMNNMLNNNYDNYLDPKDYLITMYGRVGWICCICNNFNFKTRKKCNKCQAKKTKNEARNS